MATTLLSYLPLELWEQIVDELAMDAGYDFGGMKSLRNFSLAASSQALLARCQKHLFAKISITTALEAHRLSKVLENNQELREMISSIYICPNGPRDDDDESWNESSGEEDEEGSSDDGEDNEGEGDGEEGNMDEFRDTNRAIEAAKNGYVGNADRDEEGDEEDIQWEYDANALGHPSLLGLLPLIPTVKAVALAGNGSNTTRYTEHWDEDSLAQWIKFLSLPSITDLWFFHLTVPIDLLGRSPNLEQLGLHTLHISRRNPNWPAHAIGSFPKLKHLDVQQTDLMGIGFYTFVKTGYLDQGLKSDTLQSLKLDGHQPQYDGDHWAWLGTLSVFTEFGSNTLTTLILSFPFGCYERNNSFYNHWRDRPDEIGAYTAQLRCLETIRFTFSVDSSMDRFGGLDRHGSTAFEPYLPIIIEGLVKGKQGITSPFRHLYIDMDIKHYFSSWNAGVETFNLPGFNVFNEAFINAPIWRRLDKWLANVLSTPQTVPDFRIVFDFDPASPADFEKLMLEPILSQMPKLRKKNAVRAIVHPRRWELYE
ncbi:hypothetical protein BKA70DRAFT_1256701 [Coprinopsis sp. MPI-PUGE-AT-0042]|nr:hypothetical protein BKA70DRAFT_1256701 [Coprinopsis sp. MPI-PUGE-AT-0042]